MNDRDSKEDNKNEDRPVVVRNTTDLQRLKLEKLMKNPDKPVVIPERPKGRTMPPVPDFVRNVMGSSAGAGSGEFHVYRHLRRKEYARQKFIQEKSERERLDEEYHSRIEENKKLADEKTAKKRAKRQKRKQRAKQMGKKKIKLENSSPEPSDEDSESEKDDTVPENEEKDTSLCKTDLILNKNTENMEEINNKEDAENKSCGTPRDENNIQKKTILKESNKSEDLKNISEDCLTNEDTTLGETDVKLNKREDNLTEMTSKDDGAKTNEKNIQCESNDMKNVNEDTYVGETDVKLNKSTDKLTEANSKDGNNEHYANRKDEKDIQQDKSTIIESINSDNMRNINEDTSLGETDVKLNISTNNLKEMDSKDGGNDGKDAKSTTEESNIKDVKNTSEDSENNGVIDCSKNIDNVITET